MKALTKISLTLCAAMLLGVVGTSSAFAVDAPSVRDPQSTSVSGTATNSATVEVTWERPVTDPIGYSVKATALGHDSRTGSNFRCEATTCKSTIANLNGGVLYNITVTVFASASDSNSGTVTHTAISVPYAPAPVAPVAASATQVRLGWEAGSNGGALVTEYVIRNGNTVVATSSGTSVVVSGLTAQTAYTFTVTAKNRLGEGVPASFSSVTTDGAVPAAPSAPVATPVTGGFGLAWSAPNQGSGVITGYKVYVFNSSNALVGGVRAPSPTTDTSLAVSGLGDGTYRVSIVATNQFGDSASSSQTAVLVGLAAASAGTPVSTALPASTSSPATSSATSSPATESADSTPETQPIESRNLSDFISGAAVSAKSKPVAINGSWRLVRAEAGDVLHVTIRDLAPAGARVGTWVRTPDGKTVRLSSRMTGANGVLTSPAFQFKEPGNYKISWVHKGAKRSLVVFVSK